MTTRFFTRFLFVLLLFSLSGNIIQWQYAERRNTVISVPDGDSLDLADSRRIRLLGIDAPERGRCMTDEARSWLSALVNRKRVFIKDTLLDDFGRILANVSVGNTQINQMMVRVGLARNRSSVSNPYYQVLKDAQGVAKSAQLGIWSDVCRAKTSGNEDCSIKGNIRAGDKRYYLSTCTQYDQVIVDTV